MFDHHDSRYNLVEIAKQFLLVEEHLVGNKCADCLTKHYLTIMAYAEEGLRLQHGQEEPYKSLLISSNELAKKHLSYVLQNQGQYIPSMIQEVREVRKKIFNQVLGVSDIHHVEKIAIE
jgi:hypothetical protein